ncbi:MAG TPA: SURF1 family protein [Afifellaceae bacterium]|nr:SURF1 family protein [Afifellaceae bacterium]
MSFVPVKASSTPRPEPRARQVRGLLLPALAVAAALAVLVSLGNWQMDRLAWKEELIARAASGPTQPVRDLPPPQAWSGMPVEELQYHPFRLAGRLLHDREAHVFTSLPDPAGPQGGPGYWIVTPMALDGGGTVLVNRGFAPHGRHRPEDRGEALPDGVVEVVGLLRPDEEATWLTPDDQPDKNLFYARSVEALAAAKELEEPVAPFTFDLTAEATPPGGLPQAGETRMQFSNNHLQYALTWYGIAAALVGVFAIFAWQRLRRPSA